VLPVSERWPEPWIHLLLVLWTPSHGADVHQLHEPLDPAAVHQEPICPPRPGHLPRAHDGVRQTDPVDTKPTAGFRTPRV